MKNGVGKDGKEKCKCKVCWKEYTCSSKSRTYHISHHIPKCHMIPQFYNVGKLLIDCEGKLRKRIFYPKKNYEILSKLIIAHDPPFSVVEWRVFIKYHNFFNKDFQSIYRITDKFDVMKKYDIEKKN